MPYEMFRLKVIKILPHGGKRRLRRVFLHCPPPDLSKKARAPDKDILVYDAKYVGI